MKYSLGISDFLDKISSLSHSIVFLYLFALITEEVVQFTIFGILGQLPFLGLVCKGESKWIDVMIK